MFALFLTFAKIKQIETTRKIKQNNTKIPIPKTNRG